MKLSVSLPDSDVATLDAWVAAEGAESRSAAIQSAIKLLREQALERDYEEAFSGSDYQDSLVWDVTVGDGIE